MTDTQTSSTVVSLAEKAQKAKIWKILQEVTDPEIPVLTIYEMGILRDVQLVDDAIKVIITPTYSGCPAIDHITGDITTILADRGYDNVQVELVLSPAWTTDWMNDEAKEKMRKYGIAPPCKTVAHAGLQQHEDHEQVLTIRVPCPQCGSLNTKQVSEFGSTACKSLWKCSDCLEPFDYFKPI